MFRTKWVRNRVKPFLILLFILCFFPIFLVVYSYYRDFTNEKDLFISQQQRVLESYERQIQHEMNEIFSDLEYIFLLPSFQSYLTGGGSARQVERDWELFSMTSGKYDQLRFLDDLGMERIRVNYSEGDSYIVPQEELQNKGGRYYFSMLLQFQEPTILLSKIDLNIEQGEIEIPHKPMLRVSYPIYDAQGAFLGAIVMNYLAGTLLDSFGERIIEEGNKVFITNDEGYLLFGPETDKLWGFMFEDGQANTFESIYQADWDLLNQEGQNVYQSEIGIFLNRFIDNGYILDRNFRRSTFLGYALHSMDSSLQVIILGEHKNNPLLGKSLVRTILDSRWKVLLILLIAGLVISAHLSDIFAQRNIAERLKEQYRSAMREVIKALEKTTSLEDDDTGNHIRRVCHYTQVIARKLNLSREQVDLISDLAALHDIGKVGVHDSILKKSGPLTQDEFEEMKKHVDIGHQLLESLQIDGIAANIARYHHENWDGTGYSIGLSDGEIPIEARIVSLVDVYDALRSKRSYKKPYSHDQAVKIILAERGRKFDPYIVDIFLDSQKEFQEISQRLSDREIVEDSA